MRVQCQLDIGNDAEFPQTKIVLKGHPLSANAWIRICIDGKEYEVCPKELVAAIDRVRSHK